MPLFKRKRRSVPGPSEHETSREVKMILDAFSSGYDSLQVQYYEYLQDQVPHVAMMIDRISEAASVDELESALFMVALWFDGIHPDLVAALHAKEPDSIANMMHLRAVWSDPAYRKGKELLRVAGITNDALADRVLAIMERDHPEYTHILGENPAPPTVSCDSLILAIKSYTQS